MQCVVQIHVGSEAVKAFKILGPAAEGEREKERERETTPLEPKAVTAFTMTKESFTELNLEEYVAWSMATNCCFFC